MRMHADRSPPLAVTPVGITVIGVGGAGGNVVNRLATDGIVGVDLIVANTDRQALAYGRVARRLHLGEQIARGMGAGGDPLVGQRAAEESAAAIAAGIGDAQLVFIAAGMGGGTGTGAAPVLAGIARERGALTVAVVTRPFGFEGRHRAGVADQGIGQLRAIADTVIIIPNDRLLQLSTRTTSVLSAFSLSDTVLRLGVQGIADLVGRPGMINIDFADIRTVMGDAGLALLGIGVGRGAERAVEAVRRAMACPLLEGQIEGARRLLLHLSGGPDLGLLEVNRAAELVARTVDAEANIIFGATIDDHLPDDRVKATLVASGFSDRPLSRAYASAAAPTLAALPQPQTEAPAGDRRSTLTMLPPRRPRADPAGVNL